ncbi:hypothetical protein BDV30DRAFT_200481 [Aspergillus minisclerotigenes]|uniref:Uncharacterized protein n=1 Tax=Aspergillus minisclerotigenes TaxID=656917 RepID=A0A5N6IU73_9EURO|nr:hypothetical protein BDV30DRAFT_200481 [Aspergillus minisclerotigenes]
MLTEEGKVKVYACPLSYIREGLAPPHGLPNIHNKSAGLGNQTLFLSAFPAKRFKLLFPLFHHQPFTSHTIQQLTASSSLNPHFLLSQPFISPHCCGASADSLYILCRYSLCPCSPSRHLAAIDLSYLNPHPTPPSGTFSCRFTCQSSALYTLESELGPVQAYSRRFSNPPSGASGMAP